LREISEDLTTLEIKLKEEKSFFKFQLVKGRKYLKRKRGK